jgi:hypothetical protein
VGNHVSILLAHSSPVTAGSNKLSGINANCKPEAKALAKEARYNRDSGIRFSSRRIFNSQRLNFA